MLRLRRTINDPRKTPTAKAPNLFTGLKITDVKDGLDSAKRQAALDLIHDASKRDPLFRQHVTTYVPKDKRELLSEEQQKRLRLMQALK